MPSKESHYLGHPDQPRTIEVVVCPGRVYVDEPNSMRYKPGMTLKVSELELQRNQGRLVEVGSDAHKRELEIEADRAAAAKAPKTRGGRKAKAKIKDA